VIRALFIAAGLGFVGLGVAGIFLPLLPTTPFLLLAAACFARGSSRLHRWLLSQPRLGPVIHDWQAHRAISRSAKLKATLLIVLTLGLGLPFSSAPVWAKVLAVALVAGVQAWLWSLPEPPEARPAEEVQGG
jgi:hypothetical protein